MRYRGKITTLEEAIQKEPRVGDVFYNTTDTHNYVWSGTEWNVLTDGVDFKMSNYELNKCVIGQMKELTPEEVDKKLEIIDSYVQESNNKYFMLLCNELNYYTVFETNSLSNDDPYLNMSSAVYDIIKNLGQIKDINDSGSGAIEIWITNNDETHCYHLFDYDAGIVPVIGR